MSIYRGVCEALCRWQWWAVGVTLLASVSYGAEVSYQYDEAGRLRKVTHDTGMAVDYTLDAAGNRTSVTTSTSPGIVQLTAGTYSGGETASQRTITITAMRINGSGGAISVPYTVTAGSATAGSDYTATSNGTLSWAAGETVNKTFTITVIDDSVYEANENLTVTLGTPTGGATLGSPTSATVTIVSDDNPSPGTVQFTSGTYTIGEQAGGISIPVSRIGGSDGAGSITYTVTAGSATLGVDYSANNSGTLSWGNGDSFNKSISITVIDDGALESNETITLTLSAPTGVLQGSPTAATLTIVENEVPGQVSIDNRFVSTQGYLSAEAHYYLLNTGDIFTNVSGVPNSNQDTGDWISPKFGMEVFEVYASGSGSNCEGLNWNTWVPLSQGWGWSTSAQNTDGGGDAQGCTVTLSIRRASNPSVIIDTAVIDLMATAQ